MAIPALEIEITADPTAADVGFKKIERSLDGLEKATNDYKSALDRINKAERAGIINSKAAAAAVRGAEQAYESAAKAAARYSGAQVTARRGAVQMAGALNEVGRSSRFNSSQLQNIGFQVGDFATQVGAGTSASQALGQQLPQLLGGFGALGAVMGAVAAIGIPLGAALLNVSGKAKTLDDRLSELEDIMSALKDPTEILTMSTAELAEKYGEAAGRVRELAEAEAQLALGRATTALQEQSQALRDVITGYITSSEEGFRFRRVIASIADDFKLAGDEAVEFEGILERAFRAETFQQQQASLQEIVSFLDKAGVSLKDIPPEVAQALSEMIRLSNATDEATAAADALSDAADGTASSIGDAADEAGRLAKNLLEAQQNRARRIAGGPDAARFEVMDEYGGSGIISVNRTGPGDRSSGRSRSRGGGRAAQPDRIGALAQSLMTESEMLENWRAESMTKLEDFNALELEALGGHAEAKLRLEEEYLERLGILQKREADERLAVLQGSLGAVSSLFSSFANMQDAEGKKSFEKQKKLRKAAAIVEGISAGVAAWRTGMEQGGLPLAALYAAASAAQTGAQIAAIDRQSYSGGSASSVNASAGGTTSAPVIPTQTVAINLQGDTFSRSSVEGLLEQIQSQLDRGGRLVFS